jgi:hypothetical protein
VGSDPLGNLRGGVRIAVEHALGGVAFGIAELPDRQRQHAYQPARPGARPAPPLVVTTLVDDTSPIYR